MIDYYAGQKQCVTLDGERIAYIEAGDPTAPPLVMVHGWLSYSGIWRHTFADFQESHHCVALDLLGHGHSDKPRSGDYSIPAQAARVLKLADRLNLKRFALIGHSMGGQIGLYIAANMPERVSRLVSVSGVVTGQLSPYIRRALTPVYRLGAVFPPVWDFSRQAMKYSWYSGFFERTMVYQRDRTPIEHTDRSMAMIPGIEVPAYRDLQAIAALDLTDALPRITAPTLAIFGKQDNTVPLENGYLVARHVPDSRLVVLDKCGHLPMVEKTAQYLEILHEFLD